MVSARHIADRIAMIHEGRIIWNGPAKDIDRSDNPYVDQFLHGRAEGRFPCRATALAGRGQGRPPARLSVLWGQLHALERSACRSALSALSRETSSTMYSIPRNCRSVTLQRV